MKIKAAIAHGPGKPFTLEDVDLDAPRNDEILVKLVATGLCHTDIVLRDAALGLPAVLGHEGAGIVEAVGSGVTKVAPGDHVVLSYGACGTCPSCENEAPFYCHDFIQQNIGGFRPDGSPTITQEGQPLFAHFFTQSSFATHALTTEANTVKVRKDAPLELLGPLGCGIQTGAGSVMNGLEPLPDEAIAIFGVGSVGLAAIMAAKLIGCRPIIAVDLMESRLDTAREMGATHTINAGNTDVVAEIMEITGAGALYSLECTGSAAVFKQAVDCLAPRGTCGLVGVPAPGAEGAVDMGAVLNKGLRVIGLIEGESIVDDFIPHLLDLHMDGMFPFDKLVSFYDLEEINQADADNASGKIVKAILRMPV
ncbi:MAG: NAD(P)-dependent alcohol dehydrogenase [Alphaproteobacteria bacterium]